MYKLTVLSLVASLFLSFHHPIHASTLAETEKMLSDTSKKLAILEAKYEALADVVHILVKYGNSSGGLSPLCYAARRGDMKAVTTLIENGGDVDVLSWEAGDFPSEPRTTLLSEAIEANNIELIEKLIDLGIMSNYVSCRAANCNPLMIAIQHGSLEAFNILIQNKENLNYILNYGYGDYGILDYAICNYRYDLVVALIEAGADVNKRLPLDHAAAHLMYKVNPISLDIVRFLVEHGATRKDVRYDLPCRVISAYLESVGK